MAAKLGIADHLAAGPATSAELAAASGACETHLRRLLRTLAAMGVLDVTADQRYSLTAVGEELRADALGPYARHFGSDPAWSAWAALDHAILSGERAFDHVHGMRNWEYFARYPDADAQYQAAIAALADGLVAGVVNSYDFSRFPVVVDVGGGAGALLAEVLRRCPGSRGVLFDLPHVVDRTRPKFQALGLGDRCDFRGGDFRVDDLPSGDAYMLKFVLHDWTDEEALEILRRCREAASPSSQLLIIERVLPEQVSSDDLDALLTDMNMMVMLGGQERTTEEYRQLLAGTGFRLDHVVATGTELSVIEAAVAGR